MTAVTVYAGEADQLAVAQDALDRHMTSSATGLCLECGVPGPCYRRETAVKVFSRFMRLPRRRPGLSRPELIGARRVAVDRTIGARRAATDAPMENARGGVTVVLASGKARMSPPIPQ